MHLDKLFKTQSGKYLMSILLGFGLATLFRATCKGKNCIVFKAPPLEEVDDKIFQFDNKCYKYVYQAETCGGKNKKIVNS
jgi:hypothetical protein